MSGDEFFQELFQRPERMEYSHHPPDRVLRAYLAGRLGDEWHFDRDFLPQLRQADLNGDWGLSEVSLHILTCGHCSQRAAAFRAEALAALEGERSLPTRLWCRVRWLGLPGESGLTKRLWSLVASGILSLILSISQRLGPALSPHQRWAWSRRRGAGFGGLNLSHAFESLGQPVEFFNREALSSSLPIDSHLM